MKVGNSLTEIELDMWWAGKAGPPHITTVLFGVALAADLECTTF